MKHIFQQTRRGCSRFMLLCLLAATCSATAETLPTFVGENLTGERISDGQLVGAASFLVVTTDLRDLSDSLKWRELLNRELKGEARIIIILALLTPKNKSEPSEQYIQQAKNLIPRTLWKQTWVVDRKRFAAHIQASSFAESPTVFVADGTGRLIARAEGSPRGPQVNKLIDTFISGTSGSNL